MESKGQIRTAMKLQLDTYQRLEEKKCHPTKYKEPEGDPLKWWEEHHHLCPAVYELATKYLAISATSAPSERLFNVASIMHLLRRCRLKACLVDDMVVLRENKQIVKDCIARKFKRA